MFIIATRYRTKLMPLLQASLQLFIDYELYLLGFIIRKQSDYLH